MFSGIIHSMGTLAGRDRDKLGLTVVASGLKAKLGDSICVNGVCLTVANVSTKGKKSSLYFQLSPETLQKTTLEALQLSTHVNLEPALAASASLGGHIVQGHVDGVGRVEKVVEMGENKNIWFSGPGVVLEALVQKGSVAVDGVSLTVVDLTTNEFSVALIPFTLANTNMGAFKSGMPVNLESDVIGKYVLKYLQKSPSFR